VVELEVAPQPWGLVVGATAERSWRRDTSSAQERGTSRCWRGGDWILEVEAAGFTRDGGGDRGDGSGPCGGGAVQMKDEV
jgi:hypothetical protein